MNIFWITFVCVLVVNSIDAQRAAECSTPNRVRGQCILLNDCQPLLALVRKYPLSNAERYFLRRSQCGTRNRQVLVCCATKSKVTPGNTGPGGGAVSLPTPGVCGIGYIDKIFGGKETKIDEFPWMALLNYDKPNNREGFHCAGSLINERYVLTASHCVILPRSRSNWRLTSVRLGEWDTSTAVDCDRDDCNEAPIDVPIEEFITHPNYQPRNKNQFHDIALLRLARPVRYTDFIKPVCLPLATHLRSSTFEGISLDVAGWGQTETANKSNRKLKARVNGVSCGQAYKILSLQDTQVCAGGEEGIDSCRGDSGGPLVGIDNATPRPYFYLAGLVSYGPVKCGMVGWPGIYTRVSSYLDWIQSNMRA